MKLDKKTDHRASSRIFPVTREQYWAAMRVEMPIVCVWVCGCGCVGERERERGKDRKCKRVCGLKKPKLQQLAKQTEQGFRQGLCVYVNVSVCLLECGRERRSGADCWREASFSPDSSALLLKPTDIIGSFAKKNTLISGFPLIKS